MPITVATIHGKDHLFFKENGGWSSPPLVIINNLCKLDCPIAARIIHGKHGPKEVPALSGELSSQERHICLILLNHRYSLAMALMDLAELAAEFGKSVRQMQRWIQRLSLRGLIKVTPRAGRPSIIDVSPLVVAVKKLLNWQEEQQPAPVETLVEVAPEPTEEELFWLQAADSEEEEPECEEEDIWEDIKGELRKLVPFEAFRNHLQDTEGLRWEDDILIVSAKPGSMGRLQEFKAAADLLIADRYLNALGVKFEPVKQKPKKLGPLARLAVAAVGV